MQWRTWYAFPILVALALALAHALGHGLLWSIAFVVIGLLVVSEIGRKPEVFEGDQE